MTRAVHLEDFVRATAHMDDAEVVRWFALDDGTTLELTFGELRRVVLALKRRHR